MEAKGGAPPGAEYISQTRRDGVRVIQQEQKVNRKLTPRFFVIVAIFLVSIYLVYGYVQGYAHMRALRHQIADVQRQIADLEERNRELEQRIRVYDGDAFVERRAREDLGLVKPGEIPVIVIDR